MTIRFIKYDDQLFSLIFGATMFLQRIHSSTFLEVDNMKKGLFGAIALLVFALIGGAILKTMGAPALAIKGATLVAVFSVLIGGKLIFDYFWKKRR